VLLEYIFKINFFVVCYYFSGLDDNDIGAFFQLCSYYNAIGKVR